MVYDIMYEDTESVGSDNVCLISERVRCICVKALHECEPNAFPLQPDEVPQALRGSSISKKEK